MRKRNVLIAVLILFVMVFSSTVIAKNTTSGGWKNNMVTSPNDFPSRIAGDPGVDSGVWSSPYTDAANATDGDYSTFAFGTVINGTAFVTWDMGAKYDVSIVTIKVDIVGPTATGGHHMNIQVSPDNINWRDAGGNVDFNLSDGGVICYLTI
jgi:hypothetical protein